MRQRHPDVDAAFVAAGDLRALGPLGEHCATREVGADECPGGTSHAASAPEHQHRTPATGPIPPRQTAFHCVCNHLLSGGVGRIAGGTAVIDVMTEFRGAWNDKAKRELGWQLCYPSWR